MTEQILRLTVNDELPEEQRRADRIVQRLTGASRRQTQGLFDNHRVRLNGEVCHEPWRWLTTGATIEVDFVEGQRYAAAKRIPKYWGFQVLYEDAQIIVVDKPAAWLTVPSPKGESNTLVQRVAEYLTKQNRGRPARVWAVQRLDRGVSGVIVLARDKQAADALRREFSKHKPQREYVAIVAGVMKQNAGEFRSRLTAGEDLRQHSTDDEHEGQLAVTRFRVERRFADATLVRVELETGRRNQIRVHFAESGHPVLGDSLYAPEHSRNPRWTAPRIALHAEQLGLVHPTTGESLQFTLPVPEEFTAFCS
jgi:23S rRNA pseudouridine1911/1915/1917 synthase